MKARKQKIIITIIMILTLIVSVPTFAFAAGQYAQGGRGVARAVGTEARNRIACVTVEETCDVYAMRHHGLCFTDADEDGICDNDHAGHGYIDSDDDGVCDNYSGDGSGGSYRNDESATYGYGHGNGNGKGYGNGHGMRLGGGRGRC